jgi:hypothetical protein
VLFNFIFLIDNIHNGNIRRAPLFKRLRPRP